MQYQDVEGDKDREDDVILSYLWFPTLGRPTSWCDEVFRRIIGVGPTRLKRLRNLVVENEGLLIAAKERDHGNVGKVPWNKTGDDVRRRVVRVLDLYTRTHPSDATLHTTNSDFQGVAGIIRALKLEDPGTSALLCASTVREIVKNELRARGLRALIDSMPGKK